MMKRMAALTLALAMLLPALACASGLSGLSGGGLSGLSGLSGEANGVVPDPAESLGQEGKILKENYQFAAGYVCTAYAYPLPGDADAFKAAYAKQAKENGFAVDEVAVEGYGALKLSLSDGTYALLIPDFDGAMLLLVQNGMTFGEPKPEGFYLSMKRNGRELEATFGSRETSCKEVTRSKGTSRSFEINFRFSRAEITLFTLRFPSYAQAGDTFYVTKDSLIDGLYLYTSEEGSLVFYDSPDHHKMKNGKDYFRVQITDMYNTPDGLVIEGEFDGSFNKGGTLYTDGSFRVLSDL
ncbi:MAG: hypothetical protein MR842_11130 [Clostridiales bacterium]|nr:hypothetical protein [Clostridiales bacterium]